MADGNTPVIITVISYRELEKSYVVRCKQTLIRKLRSGNSLQAPCYLPYSIAEQVEVNPADDFDGDEITCVVPMWWADKNDINYVEAED